MLVLSRDHVRSLVPMPVAIDLMKSVFAELSAGRTNSPLRTVIPLPDRKADALFMPAFVPAMDALGMKSVNVFRQNLDRGLPVIHAVVILIDTETGQPMALMDGTYLTALRTGAVAGAAADLLARRESEVLAVIGAGAQGVTQIAAICAVRNISRVIAVDIKPESLLRLQADLERDWPELVERVETTDDTGAAVRVADIICTATTSTVPVFRDQDVRPGTHVSGVGAFTPEMQEIPAETVERATIIVDSVEAVLAEAGDLIIPLNQGRITQESFSRELGALVTGDVLGRTTPDEITFFKSVGNAVQDVVVGRYAVDRARELGVGTDLSLN